MEIEYIDLHKMEKMKNMKNKNYKRCINCKHFTLEFKDYHIKKYLCGLTGQPILMGEAKTLCCGYWELNEK